MSGSVLERGWVEKRRERWRKFQSQVTRAREARSRKVTLCFAHWPLPQKGDSSRPDLPKPFDHPLHPDAVLLLEALSILGVNLGEIHLWTNPSSQWIFQFPTFSPLDIPPKASFQDVSLMRKASSFMECCPPPKSSPFVIGEEARSKVGWETSDSPPSPCRSRDWIRVQFSRSEACIAQLEKGDPRESESFQVESDFSTQRRIFPRHKELDGSNSHWEAFN